MQTRIIGYAALSLVYLWGLVCALPMLALLAFKLAVLWVLLKFSYSVLVIFLN